MFRGQHHCSCDRFIVKWESKSDGSDCLRYLDDIVNTHSHPKGIDYPFEFLIHFVGYETEADMSFDAFLCKVENRPRFQRTL